MFIEYKDKYMYLPVWSSALCRQHHGRKYSISWRRYSFQYQLSISTFFRQLPSLTHHMKSLINVKVNWISHDTSQANQSSLLKWVATTSETFNQSQANKSSNQINPWPYYYILHRKFPPNDSYIVTRSWRCGNRVILIMFCRPKRASYTPATSRWRDACSLSCRYGKVAVPSLHGDFPVYEPTPYCRYRSFDRPL